MNLRAYYHIFLPDDNSWCFLFNDQFLKLLDSGLFKKLDLLYVTCIGNQESVNNLKSFLSYYYHLTNVRIMLQVYDKPIHDSDLVSLDMRSNNSFISETKTLQKIWEDSKDEDFNVLYFHAKGVTSIERLLKTNLYNKFVNTMQWKKHLEWASIDNYEESIALLDDFDAVGTNISEWPSKHFSGNFWWSKSSYIKTLPDPEDMVWWTAFKNDHKDLLSLPDRLVAEMWIGSGNTPKLYSFYNDPQPPPISNLGEKLLLKSEYYK